MSKTKATPEGWIPGTKASPATTVDPGEGSPADEQNKTADQEPPKRKRPPPPVRTGKAPTNASRRSLYSARIGGVSSS